jgi:hypothetical protein
MSELLPTTVEQRTTFEVPAGESKAAQPGEANSSTAHRDPSAGAPNGSTGADSTARAPAQRPGSPPHVVRAEALVDCLAERVGQLTSVWGRRIAWAAGRVKEEAQDLWAEVQSIRHGDQS